MLEDTPSPIDPKAKTQDNQPADNDDANLTLPEDIATNQTNKHSARGFAALLQRPLVWFKRLSRPWQIAIIGGCLILCGGTVAALILFRRTPPPPAPPPPPRQKIVAPKPTTEPSRLTGLPVKPSFNKLPVTGVMIENSPDARPQSGLRDAGIVFEAVAEGGITRFLALYQHNTEPVDIGPVRSARPYFLEWIQPFDAGLAHVGGSPDALQDIQKWHIKDLDQFYNSGAYHRVNTRYAPHNMYTSMAQLYALDKSKGYNSSKFTEFLRKKDAPAAKPTAGNIDLSISGYLYNVNYQYDKTHNTYLRKEGGLPHVDARSKKQLSPKVVIVLVMSQTLAADGVHTIYGTTGSGALYLFQDGNVAKGVWKKKDRNHQFRFLDSKNKPLSLNAGQTWLTVVGSTSDIAYKP